MRARERTPNQTKKACNLAINEINSLLRLYFNKMDLNLVSEDNLQIERC